MSGESGGTLPAGRDARPPVAAAVGSPWSVLPAAPMPARIAAFLLDLACGLGGAALCALLAYLWLLWRTNGGTVPPSDAAIYAGIAVGLLWLPAWGIVTVLAWSGSGQTLGLSAMDLRIVDGAGHPPAPAAALLRFVVLVACAVPLLLGPLLLAGVVAAAAQNTLPLLLGVVVLLPVALALVDPLCCARTPQRRALHDLAAGTRVVRRG